VLERTRSHFADGAAFVDLAPVTDGRAVPEFLASALGFAGQGQETPLETLTRRLADQQLLLVVDNFEQVLDAAPVLAECLERAPGLHVLVTSRVVLRLRGEREWRVDPLTVPADGSSRAALARAPAMRMFLERVRDVRPGFKLTDANARVLAELCRRLDGLPLALELAASGMRLLTPEQVLERLDERVARPGGLSDLPDRQQTMKATLAWSYDLLPEPARLIFARLSVFAAPFTTAAAEAVCGIGWHRRHGRAGHAARPQHDQPGRPARRGAGVPAAGGRPGLRRRAAGRSEPDAGPARRSPARSAPGGQH